MLAGGLLEAVPVVVPVEQITTAGAVLSHIVLDGRLLEAVPVGGEVGDPYILVPVDVKVATDRATLFYHMQSYSIECYSS